MLEGEFIGVTSRWRRMSGNLCTILRATCLLCDPCGIFELSQFAKRFNILKTNGRFFLISGDGETTTLGIVLNRWRRPVTRSISLRSEELRGLGGMTKNSIDISTPRSTMANHTREQSNFLKLGDVMNRNLKNSHYLNDQSRLLGPLS